MLSAIVLVTVSHLHTSTIFTNWERSIPKWSPTSLAKKYLTSVEVSTLKKVFQTYTFNFYQNKDSSFLNMSKN
jgi:hypothetical protein